jgi:hypothetical protein
MLDMAETERLNMRISPELLASVDAWRRHQPDIPARATAIKRLVALGLKSGEKRNKPEPKK